ncbi:fibronectin type III domain-containing protein [bacterium]|nr:fibronectin type III domain-containing protein [bacterium]
MRTGARACFRQAGQHALAALTAAALLSLGSCASDGQRSVTDLGSSRNQHLLPGSRNASPIADPGVDGLAWPPAEAVLRFTSDDFYPLSGTQYSVKGGDTTDAAPSLLFAGTQPLNYAVYSLGGFGADIELASIDVVFSLQASPPAGTAFFFGLANYSAGRWDWFSGAPTDLHLEPANISDYVSAGGSCSLAIALSGSGSGQVDSVTFNRVGAGAKPDAPQNLQGSATWFSCDLTWDPVPGAEGYHVFRSASPDMAGAIKQTSAPALSPQYIDTKNISPETTYYYAVRAYRGAASDYSNVVELTTGTLDLQPPTDLAASATTSSVDLTWTPAPGATGYNVYRASKSDMSNEVSIGIATGSSYNDPNPVKANVNYYRLTSRYQTLESTPSETVNIFVPEIDMPAPINLRILSQVADECTIAWDWPDPENLPAYYRIYVRTVPDFKIEPPYHDGAPVDIEATSTSYRINNLPPGTIRYVRVCGLNASFKRGRLTDALPITVPTYWTMTGLETVGAGIGPIAVLRAGSDLTTSYVFESATGKVRLARRNAGVWTPEQIGLETHMGAYVKMAHDPGGDKYMVFTQEIDTGDLWGSEGQPGGPWTTIRINGNGSTAIGASLSGFDICCAATDSNWVVAHTEISFSGNESFRKILYHKRPFVGGSWSLSAIRTVDELPVYQSMVWYNNDIHLINKQPLDDLLQYGTESGSFNWTDINPTPGNGTWNGLTVFDGFLYSPTVDTATGDIGVMDNSSGNWNLNTVDGGHGFIARSSMAAGDTKLFMTYLANSPVSWYLGVLEGGEWNVQKLRIQAGGPGQYQAMGDQLAVAAIGDEPYFVFNSPDGNIYCGHGVPPS